MIEYFSEYVIMIFCFKTNEFVCMNVNCVVHLLLMYGERTFWWPVI